MSSHVTLNYEDKIAVVVIDNPPVNALSTAVRARFLQCFIEAEANKDVDAILVCCEGRTFVAGADIKEFGLPPKSPSLQQVLARLDESTKLTVAAIHGTALGGGLELALCCHYRIATDTARLGLPESTLGLIPGAGGTQRLPRLVGIDKAAEMMIGGKPISAIDAAHSGLIDLVLTTESLYDDGIAYVQQLLADRAPLRRVSKLAVPLVPESTFETLHHKTSKRYRGQPAPEKIIQCLQASTHKSFEEALELERTSFLECKATPESEAMRRIFFAEKAAARVPGISKTTRLRSINSVAIVGAGTMGAGIALACLSAGLTVALLDVKAESLLNGSAHIKKVMASQVKKGRLNDHDMQVQLARLHTSTDYAALSDCDLVIEAVFESMAVKIAVFKELDQVCKAGAIIATNTSTLDVDRIAASTNRPSDVIGLHFFSPANIMRLLEIVRGDKTSSDVIASSLAFSKQIGKLGVVVGNCFGFVGNRMLYGYGRENQLLMLEGAPPEQIDGALYDWGMAMGPNAVGDLAGLDIGYHVRKERSDLPDDPRYYRVANVLAEQGRFGQKTGKGTYLYHAGDRRPYPDRYVQDLINTEARKLGIEQREISDEEIVNRCILALIVEGMRILEEGIVSRASDIDAIWVNGYGFPRWRGGPMCYADAIGVENIYKQVCTLRDAMGEQYWKPPQLLVKLAETGCNLYDYDFVQMPS